MLLYLRRQKLFWIAIIATVFIFIGPEAQAVVTVNATVPAICGNSAVEGAETCDDGNLVSGDGCSNICVTEAVDQPHNGGGGAPPAQNPLPVLPVCGDGNVNGADECDDGNQNNDDGCSNACRFPVCGDGQKQGAEACDDGNLANGDFCSNECTATVPVCGNGVVEINEQCDDGNIDNNDGCNNVCLIPVCGDGQRQGAEQCDDGNFLDNDGCSQVCIIDIPAVCGNAVREGLEQCDDGNDLNRDGCSAQCLLDPAPICGNGFLEFGEQCDDGNAIDRDGCSAQCFPERLPRCGNRLVEFGEQCDDGNLAGGDGCSGFCQNEPAAICGNGVKERGETCDDGNQNNDDGCSQLCQFVPIPGTICGNAVREVGEQCDDGNLAAGDGCSNACQNENIVDGNNGQGQAAGENVDPLIPIVVNPDQVNPNQDPVIGDGENQNASSTVSVLAPVFEVSKPSTTPLLQGYDKKASLTKNVTVIAQNVSKNVVSTVKFLAAETKVVGDLVQKAADNPEVEKATETVVVPTTVAVVVASVAPSFASIFIPLLRFLFLQPLLLFGRKKREEWGQIYNTLTKLPVDLAMIRLVDPKTKRIVQSRVTDAQGRYLFIVDPGEYLLEVAKPGFQFPSKLLQGVKSDGKLLDIYHGEVIQVHTAGIGITPNIPLDPIGADKTPRRIVWERRWLVVQHAISVLGIVTTALGIYISPVWYMWVFLGVHIFAYLGFVRFVKPKKPKGWGLVSEKDSTIPLGNAVVRLFTKQYNKLVSTQVTDKEGHYAFLVGPSEYYVTYEKKGYKPHTTESFQINEDAKSSVIKEKVSLEKEK